jgi:hypothetical protein
MSWGGYKLTGTPMFVLAWFVVPLLPLIEWEKGRMAPARDHLASGAGGALPFRDAGAGRVLHGPWPFRWDPYFHMATILLFLAFATRAGFAPVTRSRIALVVLLLALSGLSSWQADPLPGASTSRQWPCAPLQPPLSWRSPDGRRPCASACWGGVAALLRSDPCAVQIEHGCSGLGIAGNSRDQSAAGCRARRVYDVSRLAGAPADAGRLGEFQTGMMARVQEAAMINGYTPDRVTAPAPISFA